MNNMEPINLNAVPLHTLSSYEATNRLTQVVKQAYFRRSRQLPANLGDIVETLKGDILRVMPAVTINQIDEAVTDWVLNQIDKTISPAFFFAAIRSRYDAPRRMRTFDREEYTRPDTEEDYLSLMDTLAAFIDKRPIFFNSWREYDNLVERGQLAPDAWQRYTDRALVSVKAERTKDGRPKKIDLDIKDENVQGMARRFAVEDWLRSCNTQDKTPSEILKNSRQ